MQEFVAYVVKGLEQHPEAASVTPVERNGVTVYELRLHPSDVCGARREEAAGAALQRRWAPLEPLGGGWRAGELTS